MCLFRVPQYISETSDEIGQVLASELVSTLFAPAVFVLQRGQKVERLRGTLGHCSVSVGRSSRNAIPSNRSLPFQLQSPLGHSLVLTESLVLKELHPTANGGWEEGEKKEKKMKRN